MKNSDLIECENYNIIFMEQNDSLRRENLKLKGVIDILLKENQRLKQMNDTMQHEDRTSSFDSDFSDTTQLARTSSFGSDRTSSLGSDRTSSFGSEISDTTGIDEEVHNCKLEVQFSLDEGTPDYKVNINLRVTNRDTINDIKQNILDNISLKDLNPEQIIIINSDSGEIINENNPNLFNLIKNGNVRVVVIDEQHDFLSEGGGSYKRRKSKRRKSKTRRRRR